MRPGKLVSMLPFPLDFHYFCNKETCNYSLIDPYAILPE